MSFRPWIQYCGKRESTLAVKKVKETLCTEMWQYSLCLWRSETAGRLSDVICLPVHFYSISILIDFDLRIFQYQFELNEMITADNKWPYQLHYEANGCNYMFVCYDSFDSTMHNSVMWYYNAKYIKSKVATLSQASELLIRLQMVIMPFSWSAF